MNSTDVLSGFSRNFFIFVNEDAGFDAGQKPSGHVKLEIRDGKGKLHAVVHNLREGGGRFEYALQLLCARKGSVPVCAVRAGNMAVRPGRAELEWSFDPRNVGASGYSIDQFNVAVIVAEYTDRQHSSPICPLVAYRGKRIEWRNGFTTLMAQKRAAATPTASVPAAASVLPQQRPEPLFEEMARQEEVGPIRQEPYETEREVGTVRQEEIPPQNETEQREEGETEQREPEPLFEETARQEEVPPQNETGQREEGETEQREPEPPPAAQPAYQYPGGLNNIDTGCVYLNGNLCGAFVNSGTAVSDPCAACHVRQEEQSPEPPQPDELTTLHSVLDNSFEQSDPFHSRRSDYVWWKVTNPVNLNNILYQNNIRSPLLFNPAVMMAHYKYHHLIIGIFTYKSGKKYVVCGVPGMHMVDMKPFGDLSKWVQAEGNRVRYGAFGYWLVYINPEDGKILHPGSE